MSLKLPNIAKLGNRRPLGNETGQIIGRICGHRRLRAIYHQVDFTSREAGELDIEIKFDQILEMASQQIKIPNRLLWKPIVSDYDGPLLGIAQSTDR